jgi:hypothetical protein
MAPWSVCRDLNPTLSVTGIVLFMGAPFASTDRTVSFVVTEFVVSSELNEILCAFAG